ncbi:MAG: pilus assembly protein [Alphaproteobacteria bacterium]|nr:pilus assembly protein [Alphaproteobacteria bacterium]
MSLRRRRSGQSTTEFALMLPLIFAIVFAVIEYAYYFGAIHYVNYATFSAARALQANDDADAVASSLLSGNMVDMNSGQVSVSTDRTTGTVTSTFNWSAQTPGFRQLMGSMRAQMSVTMGPPECTYESRTKLDAATGGRNAYRYADNSLECN